MQAVIVTGGKQYSVKEGDVLFIEKLNAEADSTVTFDQVLAVVDGENSKFGTPVVSGASVEGKVLKNGKGKKITIFKYRILILALGGKGQGDTGFFFIHLGFHTVAQHIRDGALGKLHSGGDGSTDNVRPSLAIAAVTRDGEPGDSPVLIEKFNSSHYTEIFSICTLV